MEGYLRKRCANLPIMTNRYCVISNTEKTLRSYKTKENYKENPTKYLSMHYIKCLGLWTGKGTFHVYPNAFVIETTSSKLFHCSAPTPEELNQWMNSISFHPSNSISVIPKQSNSNEKEQQETLSQDSNENENEMEEEFPSNEINLHQEMDPKEYQKESESNTKEKTSENDRLFASVKHLHRQTSGEPDDWGIYNDSPTSQRPLPSTTTIQHEDSLLLSLENEKVDDFLLSDDPLSTQRTIKTLEQDKKQINKEVEEEEEENILIEEKQKDQIEDTGVEKSALAAMAAARLEAMREDERRSDFRKKKSVQERPYENEERKELYYERMNRYASVQDLNEPPIESSSLNLQRRRKELERQLNELALEEEELFRNEQVKRSSKVRYHIEKDEQDRQELMERDSREFKRNEKPKRQSYHDERDFRRSSSRRTPERYEDYYDEYNQEERRSSRRIRRDHSYSPNEDDRRRSSYRRSERDREDHRMNHRKPRREERERERERRDHRDRERSRDRDHRDHRDHKSHRRRKEEKEKDRDKRKKGKEEKKKKKKKEKNKDEDSPVSPSVPTPYNTTQSMVPYPQPTAYSTSNFPQYPQPSYPTTYLNGTYSTPSSSYGPTPPPSNGYSQGPSIPASFGPSLPTSSLQPTYLPNMSQW